jgi:hypothetical protein
LPPSTDQVCYKGVAASQNVRPRRLLVAAAENATLLPDVSAETATLQGALKEAEDAQNAPAA